MWRVRHKHKGGDDKQLIPASAYLGHDDGRLITIQCSEASTKAEIREQAEEICEAMNFIAGYIHET